MTVASETRKSPTYVGNGVAASFAFNFKIFEKADLRVVSTVIATAVDSDLVLDSDYSVTLNPDQNANPGGSITYPLIGSLMDALHSLVIVSDVDALQETDIANLGGFYPEVIEDALDREMIVIQQLQEQADRALTFPVTESAGASLPSVVQRAEKVLAFDINGDPVAVGAVDNTLLALQLASTGGSALVGFIQAGVGAGGETVETKLRQIVNAKDWKNANNSQVAFNGVQDDSTGLEACSLALFNAGGGIMYMPPGTAMLGTLSADPAGQSSYILPRNGVSFIGAGRGVTVLKIKAGENARFPAANAPNVIATGQAGPLTNARFADFTVDWNGANNLLTAPMTARNNAAILTIKGAQNLTIERVNVKEVPGNQCILISNSAMATVPGGNIVVRDVECRDCGSGLAGNYNIDHSSIYIMGNDSLVENCVGVATQTVAGAFYELHGSRVHGRGNKSNFYERGFWMAADFNDCSELSVDGDMHTNVNAAFAAVTTGAFAINNVKVSNSTFRQKAGAAYGVVAYFVNGGPIASCDNFEITRCRFYGISAANLRFFQLDKIQNFSFDDNYVKNFDDATNGLGIAGFNLDLGGGFMAYRISICRNKFELVRIPVSLQPAVLALKNLTIQGNEFSTAGAGTAVIVNVTGGQGDISDNKLLGGFTAVASLVGTDDIWGTDVVKNWVPTLTFVTPGDLAVTYATRAGRMRKVGNKITATFNIMTSAFTHTTAVGNLRVTGLTKASENVAAAFHIGAMYYGGITDAARPQVVARVAPNVSFLDFLGSGSAAGPNVVSVGQVPTGGTVNLVGEVEYSAAA